MSTHILIIEDEQELSQALTEKLTSQKFKVTTASTGKEGWHVLQQQTVDLIILDVILPNTDGLWFIKNFKENYPPSSTKIIVLTNLEQGEKLSQVIAQGPNRVLVKANTSLKQLIQTINELQAEESQKQKQL